MHRQWGAWTNIQTHSELKFPNCGLSFFIKSPIHCEKDKISNQHNMMCAIKKPERYNTTRFNLSHRGTNSFWPKINPSNSAILQYYSRVCNYFILTCHYLIHLALQLKGWRSVYTRSYSLFKDVNWKICLKKMQVGEISTITPRQPQSSPCWLPSTYHNSWYLVSSF